MTVISPQALPTPAQLESASQCEIVDKDGKKTTFGNVTRGKRVVVVFIRHFWCGICQAYISQLGISIPPTNLPQGTSLIVIGCGDYQPIQAYFELTESPYEIYANPSIDLFKIFQFSSTLARAKKGEEREYEKNLGGFGTRLWDALRLGPLRNFGHVSSVGPKSQNGGEMVLESDGTCSFMYRMQNTADHTDLVDLARAIGASYTPLNEPFKGNGKTSGTTHPVTTENKTSIASTGTTNEVGEGDIKD